MTELIQIFIHSSVCAVLSLSLCMTMTKKVDSWRKSYYSSCSNFITKKMDTSLKNDGGGLFSLPSTYTHELAVFRLLSSSSAIPFYMHPPS